MNVAILSIVAGFAVAALVAAGAWGARVVLHEIRKSQPRNTPPPTPDLSHVNALAARIDGMEGTIQDLFKAVAEGIAHVDRNEKRVRGIITGAKRRFEAEGYVDPGVDAEEDSLPEFDATGFSDEPVPPLPAPVGPGAFPGVPGMMG